ncbi:hydrogenase expression/formation protein HypD [Legionella geestiana]|uniref:Hydrogenase maturation factor n=1 Tax=Legionella geestiana TaxID=45065 RepID=A0A0W0TSU7_9GAMM|nr:hydrogenase formation protein HypD [Legionella geestiana]KTC98485.1 hydrogenase expression/formation protein HypD [Legionella geestiana]QBS13110.1 hydrogenase formation protein HypD [Legionella geestiana]STX54374.1 hydrogenase expression/formation protein HypD [Legionella geestiana]
MKYIEEFRNPDFARTLSKAIAERADPHRHYRLMEFCGGHTHTIHRYGLPGLLPKNVEMVHGPGCPVCVLPMARIDKAMALAERHGVILCTYGDMLRVPGSGRKSLLQAKARGADVRMIYSADDALNLAIQHPDREVVFFAIGFETTTPATAAVILLAAEKGLKNFSVFCNHILTPVAMDSLLSLQNGVKASVHIDGFIGPAHVSILTGSKAYEAVSQKYRKPVVIAGFEPLDVLHAIVWLIERINSHRYGVDVQYTRAVTREGNLRAQKLVADVFEYRPSFEWRGLGEIAESGLQIRAAFSAFDAEKRFLLPDTKGIEHKHCACGEVLRGIKKPLECKLFAKACTPENPLGACMVSSEGACAAVYAYGRAGVSA